MIVTTLFYAATVGAFSFLTTSVLNRRDEILHPILEWILHKTHDLGTPKSYLHYFFFKISLGCGKCQAFWIALLILSISHGRVIALPFLAWSVFFAFLFERKVT